LLSWRGSSILKNGIGGQKGVNAEGGEDTESFQAKRVGGHLGGSKSRGVFPLIRLGKRGDAEGPLTNTPGGASSLSKRGEKQSISREKDTLKKKSLEILARQC